jgi:WD40 repeat protein
VVLFVLVGLVGVLAFVRREQGLRKAAEDALVRADDSTLALLEQQGRTELSAGRPLQAVAYLVEAYRRRPTSRVLAALATQAVRPLARLSRSYVGHAHDIPYVAFSPDGARFVTASTDGTSRIWQTGSGALLATLNGGDKLVDAATFSPDGQRVVAAGDRVRLFTTAGALVWRTAIPHAWRVWYCPDGKRILVGTHAGRLAVLDAATGALVADAKEHQDRIESVAFTPDGARFAVAGWDSVVTIWDAATIKVIHRLTDHEHAVTSIAWSVDGHYLASADMDGVIELRRGDTGERIRFIRLPAATHAPHLWFDRDGQTLLVTAQDGSVRRIHLASGVVLDEFDSRAFGKLMAGAFSFDGRTMVTTGVAGQITVWDLGVGNTVRVFAHPVEERAEICYSELTRDRQRLVTASEDGAVRIWDAATGAILQQFEVPNAVRVAVGNDGHRVLVGTTTSDRPAVLLDATTGARIASFEGITRLVSDIASSRDGRAFALALYDGTVRVIDAVTGAETARIAVDTRRISAVTFDLEGNPVAASESGKVWFLDRATATVKRSFAAHTTWIQDIEYSADGKRLVTAGRQDHTVKVWDAATGALQLTLSGHKNNVMRASFSPDGTWIATASVDNTALVWDATTGELAWTFLGPAFTAEWSADSRQLFTTGIDGFVAAFTLGEDPRPPAVLAAELAARSPWALVNGRLQPR